jgi:hypothetical protein
VSTWTEYEAETEFRRAARARRRARLWARARRQCVALLPVTDGDLQLRRTSAPALGAREIPVDAITRTVEPGRAQQFDAEFRPAPPTRCRWLRVWKAMHGGTPLPPISVVRVGDEYAIRDGHHRVSVAKWNGLSTISAIVA